VDSELNIVVVDATKVSPCKNWPFVIKHNDKFYSRFGPGAGTLRTPDEMIFGMVYIASDGDQLLVLNK